MKSCEWMWGLYVWKGLRVLECVWADVAIFSVPEPSNWMGGETADPLVLSVYSGAGCWRFNFAFFGSLGIVKQACFVSSGPQHLQTPALLRRFSHKGETSVPRGLRRENAARTQVLLEGSPIPPHPILGERARDNWNLSTLLRLFFDYFISSPHLGLTILSIKGTAASLFGKWMVRHFRDLTKAIVVFAGFA